MSWRLFVPCCLALLLLAAAGMGRAYLGYHELQLGSAPPSPLPRLYVSASETLTRRLLPAWRMRLAALVRGGGRLLQSLAESFRDLEQAP